MEPHTLSITPRTSFPRRACRHILSPGLYVVCLASFSSCNLVSMFCYQHSRATVLLHALLLLPHLRILYSCVAHSTLLSLASHRRTSPRALCWYSRVLSSSLNLLYLLEYSLLCRCHSPAVPRHRTYLKINTSAVNRQGDLVDLACGARANLNPLWRHAERPTSAISC